MFCFVFQIKFIVSNRTAYSPKTFSPRIFLMYVTGSGVYSWMFRPVLTWLRMTVKKKITSLSIIFPLSLLEIVFFAKIFGSASFFLRGNVAEVCIFEAQFIP